MLDNNPSWDTHKLSLLVRRLDDLDRRKCQGACVRARVQQWMEGEKSTAFYLGLEKRNKYKSVINSLLNDQKVEVCEERDMLKISQLYYQRLFSSETIDRTKTDHLYSLIKNKLTKEETQITENKIVKLEVETALQSLGNNKSPGRDGMTTEF